jgi:(p)ppGpp synthase/HD superfamily hydrolase
MNKGSQSKLEKISRSKAFEIVHEAFFNKKDRAGKPYIFHLMSVAKNVNDYSPTPTINYYLEIVALLHDLLEDCEEWNAERLAEHFHDRVVKNVVTLTKQKNQSYEDYIENIVIEFNNGEIAPLIVKLADLQDNMTLTRLTKTLTEKDLQRILKYHAAYLKLLNIFNEKFPNER